MLDFEYMSHQPPMSSCLIHVLKTGCLLKKVGESWPKSRVILFNWTYTAVRSEWNIEAPFLSFLFKFLCKVSLKQCGVQRTPPRCPLHVDKQGAAQRSSGCTVPQLEATSAENPICAGHLPLFSPHFQPHQQMPKLRLLSTAMHCWFIHTNDTGYDWVNSRDKL